ncbi:MAG: cupin domain-containing protein [Dermatophilaceae bacterium]
MATRPNPATAMALAHVGPRLKALRQLRHLTLGEVSLATGISTSTLSRLEHGERRPTLELLLSLSQLYAVPLDHLVGAPAQGDPRIHLRATQVKGRAVIPLTVEPGAAQAWKIILPVGAMAPERRVHDGHEWIYVLSGRVRLVVADEELLLDPGDVATFDTGVAHTFGNGGDTPAELLSIFGRPSERMTLRTSQVRVTAALPGDSE